jgi:hypothetical protein
MADLPPDKRLKQLSSLVKAANAFYGPLRADSDLALISINAAAAQETVEATHRGIWSEMPTAVYAVLVVQEAPRSGQTFLATDVCDLTRKKPQTHVLTVELPPDIGRKLVIKAEDFPDLSPQFSVGVEYLAKITAIEELVKQASPPDRNGVRVLSQAPKTSNTALLLPDPGTTRVYFSVVNALGRTSNAVRVLRLDLPAKGGTFPRRPFGNRIW